MSVTHNGHRKTVVRHVASKKPRRSSSSRSSSSSSTTIDSISKSLSGVSSQTYMAAAAGLIGLFLLKKVLR